MENTCYLGEIPLVDGTWGYVCMVCGNIYYCKERQLDIIRQALPFICPESEACHEHWENGDYEGPTAQEYFDVTMKYFGENNLVATTKIQDIQSCK